MTDGKWVISGCEERWDFAEIYDSKEEAIAAVPGYCDEHDRSFAFVGKARRLTYEALLTQWDVERMVEAMDERAYEEGGAEDQVVDVTTEQHEELRKHILAWMNKNLNPINWHVVEDVTEHKA